MGNPAQVAAILHLDLLHGGGLGHETLSVRGLARSAGMG
jgi:hypothetical protein